MKWGGSVRGWFDDFGALNLLAMAAAYSPKRGEEMNIELSFEPTTARIRPEVWDRWLERDPVRFIPAHPASFKKLKSIWVECGTRDEFNLRWGARIVVEELRKLGVDVVHEEFEDGHSQTSYRYDRSLAYILPRMARS